MPRHRAGLPSLDRNRAFLRIRAVLAGGLLLGMGGSLTLAAWNDSEFAHGTFTASTFNIQSSVDGGASWQDSLPSPGASMAFGATGMSPGMTEYAQIRVRTTPGSLSGTLALQGATNDNPVLATALEYRVIRDAGVCGSALFTSGAAYIAGSFSGKVALGTPGAPTAVAGNQSGSTVLCFEVSTKAGAASTLQGQGINAVWEIRGTSDS